MPSFRIQSTNQEPKVLVVGEQNLLTKLVGEYYQQHRVEVFLVDFEDPHFLNRCREIADENELYKIVLVCGMRKKCFQDVQKLTSILNQLTVPQIYIAGISTKIDSKGHLTERWSENSRREDELLQFLLQQPTNKRLIIGQDIFSQDNELIPPIRFILQADGNEVWFDPQQSLYLQTPSVFFNSFKKELLRPGSKNLLIKGSKIKSGEFIDKLSLLYQSFYNKNKSVLKIETTTAERFKKKEDLVEVVVDADLDHILKTLCRDLPSFNLSLDPHLLSKVKNEFADDGQKIIIQPKEAGYSQSDVGAADAEAVPRENISCEPAFVENSAEAASNLGDQDSKDVGGSGEYNSEKGLVQKEINKESNSKNKKTSRLSIQEPVLVNQDKVEDDEAFQELKKIYGKRNERQKAFFQKQNLKKSSTPSKNNPSIDEEGENELNKKNLDRMRSSKSGAKKDSKSKSKDKASKKELKSLKMDEEIGRLFSSERTSQKTRRRQDTAGLLASIQRKSKRKQAIFWLGTTLAVLGLLFVVSLGGLVLNYRRSQRIITNNLNFLQQGEYKQLKPLSLLRTQAVLMGKVLDISVVTRSRGISQLNLKLMNLADNLKESEQAGQRIFSLLTQSSDGGGEGEQRSLEELIDQKTKIDQRLYQEAALLQAEINEQELAYFEPELQKELEQSLKSIQSLKKRASSNLLLNSELTGLLGLEGEKTYFLVIQDDQELRPTGGFIQALAMIVLRDGRIADQRVINVNEIDNKTMGRLSAPAEISTLLGEEKLYLRDANWNPDFKDTARTISWFINEALNQPVDGIIGVNYNLAQNLLKNTGEITVESYEEKVGSSNLYDRLRYHANEEKEQFLEENFQVSFWKTLLEELKELPADKQRGVINTFLSSFNNHQSTVYISDPDINQVMTKLGWSGELIQPECPSEFSENCLVDQIYQVEANIGINKVNPFITRQLAHHIEIESTQIVHQRQLEVSNKTQSQIWPLGNYKAYFRFYLNPEANLVSLELDGESVPQENIIEYIDHNRKVLGVVVEVPPGSSKKLALLYSISKALKPGDSYFFFNQAQPGLSSRSAVISLSYPESLTAALVAPQVDYEQNQLVTTNDKGHAFLVVRF